MLKDPLRKTLSTRQINKINTQLLIQMCILNKFNIIIKNTQSQAFLYNIHTVAVLYIAQREQNAINFIIFIEIVADVNLRLKVLFNFRFDA